LANNLNVDLISLMIVSLMILNL